MTLLLSMALQVVDHDGRDFTVEGLTELSGTHADVRIYTVTALGEAVGEGGAEVRSKAVVIDGVVAGGPEPFILAGGGLEAGRYPVLLSPPDEALIVGSLTLAWYPASRATGLAYKLTVTAGDEATVFSNLTATTAGPLPLDAGTYTWTVEAVSVLGAYPSEAWEFTLVPSVPPPGTGPITPLSDVDGDGTTPDPTPTLTWPPVPGATAYVVTIYDAQGNPVPSAGATTPTNGYTVPVDLPPGTYTVVIQPVDAAGNPVGGPIASALTIDAVEDDPPQPDIDGDGTTTDPTPTLTWSPVPGAGGYVVTILDAQGNPVPGAGGTTLTPGYTIPVDLPPGTYTVAIQPIDGAGNPVGDPIETALTVDPNHDVVASFPIDDPAGGAGWEFDVSHPDVTWSMDDTPASIPGGAFHSAPYSLNYNNGEDYITPGEPNRGVARTPAVALDGLRSPRLRFWCNFDTRDPQTFVDQRWVRVVGADGAARTDAQLSSLGGTARAGRCATSGTWHEHTLALEPAWGQVRVEFVFDTLDVTALPHAGWFVDDVEIVQDSPQTVSSTPSASKKRTPRRPSCLLGRLGAAGTANLAWIVFLVVILGVPAALRLRIRLEVP